MRAGWRSSVAADASSAWIGGGRSLAVASGSGARQDAVNERVDQTGIGTRSGRAASSAYW